MPQTPKPTNANQRATTVKDQDITKFQKRQREQSEDTQNNPGNKNSGAKNSIRNNNTKKNSNNNNYKDSNTVKKKPKIVYSPVRHV